MTTRKRRTPTLSKAALADGDLANAIRGYVRTCLALHGLGPATRTFGVSRHTLQSLVSWKSHDAADLDKAESGVLPRGLDHPLHPGGCIEVTN